VCKRKAIALCGSDRQYYLAATIENDWMKEVNFEEVASDVMLG